MAIQFARHPGLVVYLTAGDTGLSPRDIHTSRIGERVDLSLTRDVALAAIDAGADILELGVPFSDPLGDGPVIQRASERALARGTRLLDVLALAAEIRAARPQAGLVMFSYLNPILRFGLSAFADASAAAGVDGVLIIDMIVEEAGEYLAEMKRVNLAPIFLAAPTSPDERLKAIAEHSQGFVYAISRTGITGQQKDVESGAAALVERLRRWTHWRGLPIAVGFGISNADHVAQVGTFADAAVIGSAIVELIERSTEEQAPEAVSRFIRGLFTQGLHRQDKVQALEQREPASL
jgi:tryptophan synthase alpha chain